MKTYSDHENVNILTALLTAHGIKDVIVCPGSRNAPLAHNFEVCPALTVHPVTDERSAGFYALGMALHTHGPVAVCVTSGTALLNLYPAVAEACYRHAPLVVISADRPAAWIGQLDGQTLPQQGALGCFVRTSVTLPEPHNAEEHWYVNRLINEALAGLRRADALPVHINVPLSEPLYHFTVPTLPDERTFLERREGGSALPRQLTANLATATHPLLVIGQTGTAIPRQLIDHLARHMALLYEPLSADGQQSIPEDNIDQLICPDQIDLILYAGDCLVNKRMRHLLRQCTKAQVWGLGYGDATPDPTMHLRTWYQTDNLIEALHDISACPTAADRHFITEWNRSVECRRRQDDDVSTAQPAALAVSWLETRLNAYPVRKRQKTTAEPRGLVTIADKTPSPSAGHTTTTHELSQEEHTPWETLHGCAVHYANSTAVRLGLRFAHHYIYVNRGVNGIEGCMSTAAGASLAASRTDTDVYLVIGDLSFFYDANALWNTELTGNLHILLLNNGGGAIFNRFKGLEGSPARERTVMACHCATAQGLCESYGIRYLHADGPDDLTDALWHQFATRGERPVVLEVSLPL